MTDIRLAQVGSPYEAVSLDFLLTPAGELDTTQELSTAMIVALLTDGLAAPDDQLPDARDDDRRGWWGDLDAGEIWNGWPIGSKLWLLARTTITGAAARKGATTVQIEAYIREALQPFLDRKIGSRLDVNVVRLGLERVSASITLYRGPKPAIQLQFADLWAGIIVSAPTT